MAILALVAERWPAFYEPALQWLASVERAIVRRDHPEQGAFIAIINAIEFQFEIGAHPATVQLLIGALNTFVTSRGLPLNAVGLEADPSAIMVSLAPKGSRTR